MHLGQVKLFIYLGKAYIDDLMIFKVERCRQAPYQCFKEYELVTYSAGAFPQIINIDNHQISYIKMDM